MEFELKKAKHRTYEALEVNVIASVLPSVSESEYEMLKRSIEEEGQQEPVIVYKGQVIDGRARLKVCKELGIGVIYQEIDGFLTQASLRRAIAELNEHKSYTFAQLVCSAVLEDKARNDTSQVMLSHVYNVARSTFIKANFVFRHDRVEFDRLHSGTESKGDSIHTVFRRVDKRVKAS